MWYILFLILGMLAVFVELLMLSAWVRAKIKCRKDQTSNYMPTACIIVPCKFVGINFEKNIKAICDQEYKNFKVLWAS